MSLQSPHEGRPRASAPAWTMTGLAFFMLFLPLFMVAYQSVRDPAAAATGGWGISWTAYDELGANAVLGEALMTSLRVASLVALLSAALGGLGAIALERGHSRWLAVIEPLIAAPLVLPELVMGLASVLWFVALRLTLGEISIVLAHVTFAVSYVTVTVRARLHHLDPSLEEAAADLGASSAVILRRVTWPLARPGIFAGAMMAFTLSFDDFLLSFFTAGAGADTLPLKLYAMVRFGMSREMYALSTLLIAGSALMLGIARFFDRDPSTG